MHTLAFSRSAEHTCQDKGYSSKLKAWAAEVSTDKRVEARMMRRSYKSATNRDRADWGVSLVSTVLRYGLAGTAGSVWVSGNRNVQVSPCRNQCFLLTPFS